jgi:cell division transport system permease protein
MNAEQRQQDRDLILPSRSAERLPLVAVMSIMSYLAGLALVAALAIGHASHNWTGNLSGAVTVQIRPNPAMAPKAQREAVLDVLDHAPGVQAARALSDAEIRHLLEPWLGQGVAVDELPISQLVDVKLDRSAAPDLGALAKRLSAAAPGAMLDDHRRWNDRLVGFTGRLTQLGIAILVLVGIATVAIVVFATRAGLSANNETVEVLHLVGAQDGFIASQFERYFRGLALRAGGIGALAAGLTLVLARYALTGSDFLLPALSDIGLTPAYIFTVPLATALVAMITARLTVLDVLRAMP